MYNKLKYATSDWLLTKSISLLSSREKKIMLLFGFLITVIGFLETLAFGSVVPLITFILEPDKIENNHYYQNMHTLVGKPTREFVTYFFAIICIILLLVSNTLNILINHLLIRFSTSCWRRVANELMKKSMETPYEWFLSSNSSIITRLFHHDIPIWSRDGISLVLILFSDLIVFVFISIMVMLVFPKEGIWAILIAIILGFSLVMICRPKIKKHSFSTRESADKTMLSISQIFTGIKDIKINSNNLYFRDYFNKTIHNAAHAFVWLRFWGKLYPSVFILIVQVSLVLIAIFLWASGLTTSQIAVFLALSMMISSRVIPAINRIMGSIGNLINIHPFVQGIINFEKSLINARKSVPLVKNTKKNLSFKNWNSIQFADINFNYEKSNKKILKNLNFNIDRGKIYGIVGESGSGKTTIIDLLMGLLFTKAGKIKIDKVNLNASNFSSWRHEVGYVPQFPYLIDGSLKENIAFSLDHKFINKKIVRECIEKTSLNDLVSSLELGEDAQIGERGVKLSGGQKQRIIIARALYKNPSLLILDEATNALDSINEEKIINLIKSLKPNITTIMITHKTSNLKKADKIFMLENGKIEKFGTFEYLVKNSVEFRKLTSIEKNKFLR